MDGSESTGRTQGEVAGWRSDAPCPVQFTLTEARALYDVVDKCYRDLAERSEGVTPVDRAMVKLHVALAANRRNLL